MAAGLTVEAGKIDALAEWLDERLAGDVSRASAEKILSVDAMVNPRGLSPMLIETLEAAGPYGTGWPGPRVVTGPVRIVKCDIVGKDHVRAIVSGRRWRFVQGDGISRRAKVRWASNCSMANAGRNTGLQGARSLDDWGSTPKAELHVDDVALA
jgi:single-stranded-DNA-specific exonuclease